MNSRKLGGLYPVRDESALQAEVKVALTTVCLKSGSVRIPHRYRAALPPGVYVLEYNAYPVTLSVSGQGVVSGLKVVFAQIDLRPNDLLLIQRSGDKIELNFKLTERRNINELKESDLTAGAEDQVLSDDKRVVRKVRINALQYYPLEVISAKTRTELSDGDLPESVSVRMRIADHHPDSGASSASLSTTTPPRSLGEGAESGQVLEGSYPVSSDFEEWLSRSDGEGHAHAEDVFQETILDTRKPVELADAVNRIEAFLSKPETPAIVQTSKIANDLNIPIEVCELALGRISEDHERVNRIRAGAYMIRRKKHTRSAAP